METDVASRISFYLKIEIRFKEDLSIIRHWTHLKIAHDENHIWVSNFESDQFESSTIKSIPYKSLYYGKNGQLYPLGSLLPSQNIPTLKWEHISYGLPITLEKYNPNFFGIKESLSIQLIASLHEYETQVMLCGIDQLKLYIETAPEIRLQNIKWTIINNTEALLIGTPQLPINGSVYEINQHFIIPAGFTFELHLLIPHLNQKLNPNNDFWIVWNLDSTYFKAPKNQFQQLSLSSFRKSMDLINTIH